MGDFPLDLKSIVAIISLITSLIAAVISIKWRAKKFLTYEILSDSALLTSSESIRDNLKILYNDKAVKNVRLFKIKITNSGKHPIDDKDFKKTLDFIFAADAEILTAETISVSPENLDATFIVDNNKISIKPTLLNSGEFFIIKAIISSDKSVVKCDGRIIGAEIYNAREDKPMVLSGFIISICFFILTVCLFMLYRDIMLPLYIRIAEYIMAIPTSYYIAFCAISTLFLVVVLILGAMYRDKEK